MPSRTPKEYYKKWLRDLEISRGNESKSKALSRLIRADIEQGVLLDGMQLPTQRSLASCLGISLQTTSSAYQELERHGFIRCEIGRGSYISRPINDVEIGMSEHPRLTAVDLSTIRIVHTEEHDRLWRETCSSLGHELAHPWMQGIRPIAGFETHREAARQWLVTLGKCSNLDEIIITNGAAHAIFLALTCLASTNDIVLSEGVTDYGIIGASQILGFNLRGLETDRYGISPEHFEYICTNERVTALVCTPNISNPTVSCMLEERRREIASIARRFGVWIIENDVFGPLVSENRVPPISHYIPELSVYCTSMTKSVLTGMRTGYLAAPKRLIPKLKSILSVTGWMGTPLLDEVASRWIMNGYAEKLIGLQRQYFSERQKVVSDILPNNIIGQHPYAPFTWISPPSHWQLSELINQLRTMDIFITGPDPFTVPGCPKPHAVRVCLGGAYDLNRIRSAMSKICKLFGTTSNKSRPECQA